MIPLMNNLGPLLRLWARFYVDSRTSANRKKKGPKCGNVKGTAPAYQSKFIAARDAQIQKLKEAESIGQRRKLVLPIAQVGEFELEDIVKIGRARKNVKALVFAGSDAGGRLLSDYEGLVTARMAGTSRTAPRRKYFCIGFTISFHRAHTSLIS